MSLQEVEEEEPAEHYSDEEAPPAAGQPVPPAANSPAKEEEAEVTEEDSQSKEESKCEDKANLAGERQSGDGQVSVPVRVGQQHFLPAPKDPAKLCSQESTDDPETKAAGKVGQKLDDDEDRKNPAYIPRKGLFFEHDVRGHAQEEERYAARRKASTPRLGPRRSILSASLTVLRPKTRNRKLWKDEGRWEHDKFREEEQAPKSREELIAIYGYDIRNGGGSGERSYRQRRPR